MPAIKNLALGALVLTFSANLFAETIKLGVAGPHTGANAAFGQQLWRGASLAADTINKLGGVNGKQIELIKADDACEPKQAVAVANRLVDLSEVDAVVGHFCSSSTLPASEVYADAGTLMITPRSTNPQVTDRGLSNVFRMCGRDDQQGVVAANFLFSSLNIKKIAVIHDKDTYGKGLADAMKAHYESLGGEVTIYEGITRGEKDFNALVTKLKQKMVGAVYFGGLHTEAGPFVRQMREQGLDAAFVSGDGIVSEDFVTNAGGSQYAQGVYMTFGADPRELPTGKQVIESFRQSDYEPEGYTLYAYATVQVVAKAMQQAKSTEGEVLAKWLKSNPVDTVMGDKTWDSKGDLTVSDYVIYQWDDQGKYKQVN